MSDVFIGAAFWLVLLVVVVVYFIRKIAEASSLSWGNLPDHDREFLEEYKRQNPVAIIRTAKDLGDAIKDISKSPVGVADAGILQKIQEKVEATEWDKSAQPRTAIIHVLKEGGEELLGAYKVEVAAEQLPVAALLEMVKLDYFSRDQDWAVFAEPAIKQPRNSVTVYVRDRFGLPSKRIEIHKIVRFLSPGDGVPSNGQ
jgi:hypothetical protein